MEVHPKAWSEEFVDGSPGVGTYGKDSCKKLRLYSDRIATDESNEYISRV